MKPVAVLSSVCIITGLLLVSGPLGRFVILVPLLLFGPGYLLERSLGLNLAPLVRPTIWLGLSLTSLPLLYLWFTTAGAALSTALLWLYVLAIMAGLLWSWHGNVPWNRQSLKQLGFSPQLFVVLGVVVFGVAWTRIEQINELVAPLWVDSVHHALITRVIAETGQVPYSLRPYLPVDQFIYHWGYHALTASVFKLTGLGLPTTMLWFGQVLSFMYIIALGGCAWALWRHPLAYLVAAVVVGTISVMPGYFISWGRYTLLAGGLVIPAIIVLSWYSFQVTHRRWAWLLIPLIAGALMIHIVVGTSAVLWCVALWLFQIPTVKQRVKHTATWCAVGGGSLILAGPWLATLIARTSQSSGGAARLTTEGAYNTYAQAAGLYWTSTNRQLMAFAVLAAFICLWNRRRITASIVVWCAFVVLLANLVWLGLPYLGFFNNNIVALLIFLPITLLLAGGAVTLDAGLTEWLARHRKHHVPSWRVLRNALVVMLLLWHIDTMRTITNDNLIIARAADLEAIEWVEQHVPQDARFAINTDPWLYDVTRGVDGGWWMLPVTGRQVSTPPVIFTYGSREYYDLVTAETSWLREDTPRTPEEIAQWLRQHNYTHVYATTNARLFNSQQLAASPAFQALYQNDSVTIFAVQ